MLQEQGRGLLRQTSGAAHVTAEIRARMSIPELGAVRGELL